MYIENLTTEQLAFYVTHYIYRNTNIIENSHSDNITMDNIFYKAVHRVVSRNLTYSKKFLNILKTCNNIDQLKKETTQFGLSTKRAFVEFLGNIILKCKFFGTLLFN